jgi:large subunit ribosomal protein L23
MKKLNILKNPRITEKASNAQTMNVYTFDVHSGTNKKEIANAVFDIYKVRAVKVNVLAVPKKNIRLRGKQNLHGGGRKALVYLKAGDKIEFV